MVHGAGCQELLEWQPPTIAGRQLPPLRDATDELETEITANIKHKKDSKALQYTPTDSAGHSLGLAGATPSEKRANTQGKDTCLKATGSSLHNSNDACLKGTRKTNIPRESETSSQNCGVDCSVPYVKVNRQGRGQEITVDGESFCEDSLDLVGHESVDPDFWDSDTVCFCNPTQKGIAHHANHWQNTVGTEQCAAESKQNKQDRAYRRSKKHTSKTRQRARSAWFHFRRNKCCKVIRLTMQYSTILIIGAIVIYLFHTKCMGLGEEDMSPSHSNGQAQLLKHVRPCIQQESIQTHYTTIQQSAERLESVAKHFTENLVADQHRNDTSLQIWLELVDIQQTLKELYTNTSSSSLTTSNISSLDVPLILDYARTILPYNAEGESFESLPNSTLSILKRNNTNNLNRNALNSIQSTTLLLYQNMQNMNKIVNNTHTLQYDHIQAVSGDILKLYEAARNQNQKIEELKSNRSQMSERIKKGESERVKLEIELDSLKKTFLGLQKDFKEEFMQLLRNITLMDERVTLAEKVTHEIEGGNPGSIYRHENLDNEMEKEAGWASTLQSMLGIKDMRKIVMKDGTNQSMTTNASAQLMEDLQDQVVIIGKEMEEVINHVEGKLAKFEVHLEILEKKLMDSPKGHMNISRTSCNGRRRHLVDDSCYYIPRLTAEDRQFTWWDARFLCKEHLGPTADLAAIETRSEMNQLIKMLTNHFGGLEEFWLGASDLEHEGQWRWSSTGKPVVQNSYTEWAELPQISTETNCMSMSRGYKWVDEPCFYEKIPICELRV